MTLPLNRGICPKLNNTETIPFVEKAEDLDKLFIEEKLNYFNVCFISLDWCLETICKFSNKEIAENFIKTCNQEKNPLKKARFLLKEAKKLSN